MATAQISARVRIDLERGEQYPLAPNRLVPEAGWRVVAFTLDHPDGEYVRLSLEAGDDQPHEESTLPLKATQLPAHLQPLLQSARLTLQAIAALEAVTVEAVR